MSIESGIATESRSETLAMDSVGLPPSSIRSASDMKSNFEASSQLWSTDRSADSADRRPWGRAVPEFSIWGNSGASETGNSIWNTGGGSLSTMWQHIAGEGFAGTKMAEAGSADLAWRNAPVMSEPNGGSESLGFSDLRQFGGFGFGSNAAESNSFRPFSGSGDGWGMSSSTTAESKLASADWDITKDNTVKSDQSSGWPSDTRENEKTDVQQSTWPDSDLNGAAAHARSSSAVFDSSAGKETDSGKLPSTSSSGSMDPASSSTPQPSELTAEELLIAKMINSHEGWGTRPVRQDTPWVIETSSPSAGAVVGNVMENVGGAVKGDVGSVWNSPKDITGAGQYWGGGPAGASSTEWSSDHDIGVWNESPSAAAVNPNMWTSHAGAAAGWPNSAARINSSDFATALAAAGRWPDSVGSFPATVMNKLTSAAANSSLDKNRPTDAQWIAALTKAQPSGGWASDPNPASWGTADAHDPAGALIRAQLQLGAQPPRLGPVGNQFEVRPSTTGLKIDTWNEPPTVPDTLLHPGHWGQTPVNAGSGIGGQAQAQLEAQLQQLLKMGMTREDAIQKLTAGSVDSMNPSRPGTSLGDAIPLHKGRMLRGQSVGEASASENAALLSQLASLQQLGGGKMAHPQAAFSSGVGHRKQLSGSGAGWPTQAQAMPASGIVPGQQGQNAVVFLQSLLQPKLQYRSRIQQDRMLTQQQKRQQLDSVNAEIAALKQQIDLLQVVPGPLLAAVPPVQGHALTTLAQQLLSHLKLDQGAADGDVKGSPMDGMTGAEAEAWPSASRFSWPDNSGVRQMPPPGLGQDASDSAMWARGSGWNAANDKFKAVAGGGVVGSSPTWLLLNKFTYPLDGSRIQSLCLQQGLLQTFFFNKSASHALACFMNRDDAISARATLGTFPFADSPHPLCCADIVTSDTAKSLLNSGQWTQLSTAAGLSSVAPPAAKGRGSSTYAPSDGM